MCDIDGCMLPTTHIIDDDGVDTWLCDKHYGQYIEWKKREKEIRKELGLI